MDNLLRQDACRIQQSSVPLHPAIATTADVNCLITLYTSDICASKTRKKNKKTLIFQRKTLYLQTELQPQCHLRKTDKRYATD